MQSGSSLDGEWTGFLSEELSLYSFQPLCLRVLSRQNHQWRSTLSKVSAPRQFTWPFSIHCLNANAIDASLHTLGVKRKAVEEPDSDSEEPSEESAESDATTAGMSQSELGTRRTGPKRPKRLPTETGPRDSTASAEGTSGHAQPPHSATVGGPMPTLVRVKVPNSMVDDFS